MSTSATEPAARVITGDSPDQFVDVWLPDTAPLGSVIVLHGGYWRQKYGLDLMNPICAHLVSLGWAALNVEYRRIGETPGVWDEMSVDVLSACAVAQTAPIVTLGHSAGGQLALWAGSVVDTIDAVVALAPVADLRAADVGSFSDGAVRELLGGSAADLPDVYDAASPMSLLPFGKPQLIIHGGADDSVPLHGSQSYVEEARAVGDDVIYVEPEQLGHMEFLDPKHPIWLPIEEFLSGLIRSES